MTAARVIPITRAREVRGAAEAMDEFAPERPSGAYRRGPPSTSDRVFERAGAEALAMMRSGDWGPARPGHFVALYAHLHERVYGVAPAELGPQARTRAAGQCAQAMRAHFAGEDGKPDNAAFADFVRWVWVRENRRERARRAERRGGGRIGWGLMFSGHLVTDYRLEAHREAAR